MLLHTSVKLWNNVLHIFTGAVCRAQAQNTEKEENIACAVNPSAITIQCDYKRGRVVVNEKTGLALTPCVSISKTMWERVLQDGNQSTVRPPHHPQTEYEERTVDPI